MKNLIGKAARFTLLAAITSLPGSPLLADEGRTLYMANEGLLVEHGDTKVVFDPLFRNDYGQYLLLPPAMETALFAGEAPFDGIDAVFVSHFHGDHFSPADMLNLLESLPELQLYAPMQAVVGMRSEATAAQQNVFARVHSVSLEYGDAPVSLTMSGLLIEAVRIPHSGWPTGRVDVENIVWRVTLDSAATVAHLGDADPNDVHFTNDVVAERRLDSKLLRSHGVRQGLIILPRPGPPRLDVAAVCGPLERAGPLMPRQGAPLHFPSSASCPVVVGRPVRRAARAHDGADHCCGSVSRGLLLSVWVLLCRVLGGCPRPRGGVVSCWAAWSRRWKTARGCSPTISLVLQSYGRASWLIPIHRESADRTRRQQDQWPLGRRHGLVETHT